MIQILGQSRQFSNVLSQNKKKFKTLGMKFYVKALGSVPNITKTNKRTQLILTVTNSIDNCPQDLGTFE